MKKLLLALLVISAISCSQKNKAENFITKKVSEKLNDPSSFELVSLRIIDKSKIANCKVSENLNLKLATFNKSDFERKQAIARYEKNMKSFELVEQDKMIYVEYVFRAKNKFGAIITETENDFIPINEL